MRSGVHKEVVLPAVLLAALLCASGAGAADVPRHALEEQALQHPDDVLRRLPPAIAAARAGNDHRELALLHLAEANACRVMADWRCQRDAGLAARVAAETAGDAVLGVRGRIAESRGRIALQDFSRAEHLLGEAELALRDAPNPELLADVQLAYSSLTNVLGRHQVSADYAARGLATIGPAGDAAMRVRLLRNRARSEAQLGDTERARGTLAEARSAMATVADPKLYAELYLEEARLARTLGDFAAQVASGTRVLELAAQLANSQLEGQGREVLGLAALDAGDRATAKAELDRAYASFAALGLDHDALRVLRELIALRIADRAPTAELNAQTAAFLELERRLETADRAKAAIDFDARVQYAEQEVALAQARSRAEVAAANAEALAQRARFDRVVASAAAVVVLVLIVLFAQRVRAHRVLLRAERALAASRQRLRALADNVPALISHIDRDERYLFSNAYTGRLFGVDPATVIGRTVREVRGDDVYRDIEPYIRRVLAGERVDFQGELPVAGQRYAYQASYVPDIGPDGRVAGFFSLVLDITALKEAEQKLELLARHDSLTGIANRRQLDERLATAVARSRRSGVAIALLYLDLDQFKPINDRLGHGAGDDVLVEFARRVVACIRASDLAARLGGDEFAVLIEEAATVEQAEAVARKLGERLREPVQTRAGPVDVSASVGIAVCKLAAAPDEVLALADRALYAAKAAGRNTFRTLSDVGEEPVAPAG